MARLWLLYHLIADVAVVLLLAVYFDSFSSPNEWNSKTSSLWASAERLHYDGASGDATLTANNHNNSTNDTRIPPELLPMRTEYEFALVADLDLLSRDPHEFKWHSFLKKGILKRHPNRNYTISWTDTINLTSQTATNNRSMELSELIKFNSSLLALCDYTGIVYKISPEGQVFQRYAIADGNGEEAKPFKAEWATMKDGYLYIGSIGKEWVRNGQILHFNPQWIKTIDSCGHIENRDWGMKYNFLRKVTNTTYPGYLIHEAVEWDPDTRTWLFLPRRASTRTPYSPQTEENFGTNILIIADEHFKQAEVKTVGPLEPKWGFTSMKLIPETREIIALKVLEVAGEVSQTMITIFDRDGKFKLEPDPWILVSKEIKYEGLEFL